MGVWRDGWMLPSAVADAAAAAAAAAKILAKSELLREKWTSKRILEKSGPREKWTPKQYS